MSNTTKYNADYWKSHRLRLLIKKALRYKNDPLYQLKQRIRSRKQANEKSILRKIVKGVKDEGKG